MKQNPQKVNSSLTGSKVYAGVVFRNLVLHLHPVRIPKKSIAFNHTFGLGGMLALLFVLQAFTGILLRFVYQPSPEKAYDSILSIQQDVFMGQFVRNIHHTAGMLMVVLVFFHLLRVVFTEAYKPPRRGNWIIGVVLLLLVIFSNFSGYLLPWDQLSFWAVTVATSMLDYLPFIGEKLMLVIRGGEDVGAITLLNFYNFHTGIFPLSIVILMAFHFWKVRKAGGVVIPGGAGDKDIEKVQVYPNLVAREFVVALVLLALIFLVSSLRNVPLLERANPALSPNPAKAPWYFMGIQELLMHLHPFFAAILIPFLFIISLFSLTFLRFREDRAGIWFSSDKGKRLSKKIALVTLLLVPVLVLASELIPDMVEASSGVRAFIINGLIPFFMFLFLMALFVLWLSRKGNYNMNEIVQGIFVFIISSYLVLMFIGIWFRGEGMELCWPWMR